MFNGDKIVQIVDFDPSKGYKEWKSHRLKLISTLGRKLFQLSDSQLVDTFEQWESVIQNTTTKGNSRLKLNLLMIVSLIHYFHRDLDQIKSLLPCINEYLKSHTLIIIQAATQVLNWIASENPEGFALFSDPIHKSFEYIQNKSNEYYINALLLLKKAKRFPLIDFTNTFLINFQTFFSISCDDDPYLRTLSIKMIDFIFRYISVHSNANILKIAFDECNKYLMSNYSSRSSGPLFILHTLFDVQSSLFPIDDNFKKLVVERATSTNEVISLEALSFAIDIAEVIQNPFSRDDVNTFVGHVLMKCQTSVYPQQFYEACSKLIKPFKKFINVDPILSFCSLMLYEKELDHSIYSAIYNIIKSVRTYIPSSWIDPQIFIKVDPCIEYSQCLNILRMIPNEVHDSFLEYVTTNLASDDPEKVISAMFLIKESPDALIDSDILFSKLVPHSMNQNQHIRLELVRCLKKIERPECFQTLVYMAQYDPWKNVRSEALRSIQPATILSLIPEITQTLSDPSFKVRRIALELLSDAIKYNPLDFLPELTHTVEHVISSIQSLSNAKVRAQIASLLPIIVTHYADMLEAFIPNIVIVCLDQLKILSPNPEPNAIYHAFPDIKFYDRNNVRHRDHYKDPNSFLFNLQNHKSDQPNRLILFLARNEKYIDDRDGFLLQTFACLGKRIYPFLNEILSAFYWIFAYRNSPSLLTTAANSLSKIATNIQPSLNLRITYPAFIPVLTKLLYPAQEKDVTVAILKLLGTAFDYFDSNTQGAPDEKSKNDLSADITNPSYFTDFVMSHLLPYLEAPTLNLYETLTLIYESASQDAGKYIDKVIPVFLNGIQQSKERQRSLLFEQLSAISRNCTRETLQFLPEITRIISPFIKEANCMKLCASLSFHFLASFIPYAPSIFLPSLMHYDTTDYVYFKYLMKFCSFAVIFQNQPFCQILDSFETMEVKPKHVKYISKTLICLMQSVDLRSFQSRISHFTFTLLKVAPAEQLLPLIYNLAVFTSVPYNLLANWLNHAKITSEYLGILKKIMSSSIRNPEDAPFIKQISPTLKERHFKLPNNDSRATVLDKLEIPEELNIRHWLEELNFIVVANSPVPAIRSCYNFIQTKVLFRLQLFPIAFLSGWLIASKENKEHFSNIFREILKSHQHVNQSLMLLAEITDRVGMPLNVCCIDLANACESRPLALYFLEKQLRNTPDNQMVIEKLLALNTSLGRINDARALLNRIAKGISVKSTAKWYELLRDWVKALEYYNPHDESTLPNRIRCLAHLEQWNKIRKEEPRWHRMLPSDKAATARYFAWAFFKSDNFNKVDEIILQFPQQKSQNELIFLAVYYLKTSRYTEAQDLISYGFSLLARDKAVYGSGDINLANNSLASTQLIVELQDMLNLKSVNDIDINAVLNMRLKGFKRNSDTWIKLVEIRNNVLMKYTAPTVYIKMINVLRKERNWKLLELYMDRFFSKIFLPEIEVTRAKCLYDFGNQTEALNLLKTIIYIAGIPKDKTDYSDVITDVLQDTQLYSFISCMKKQPSFDFEVLSSLHSLLGVQTKSMKTLSHISDSQKREFLIDLYNQQRNKVNLCIQEMISSFTMSPDFLAKIYREYGIIMYQVEPKLHEISSHFKKSIEYCPGDYRTWQELGRVNAALVDSEQENKDQYYFEAVECFLKAAQKHKGKTLEYLCHVFTILFKISDSSIVSDKLINELYSIPVDQIVQILPQVAVQIANHDIKFQNIIHNILLNFGRKEFQLLFLQLNVYLMSEGDEKTKYAKDIIDEIGANFPEEKADCELFVKGMMNSALTCFEKWIITIENAVHANHEKNEAKVNEILGKQFHSFDNPTCEYDRILNQMHGNLIRMAQKYYKIGSPTSISQMWSNLQKLFALLKDNVNKLEMILLPKSCESLANKHGYNMKIPGTLSKLESIEPVFEVVKSQQRPRIMFLVSDEGQRVKFLLKGNDDLRLDQRIMQFFSLVNSLLNHSRAIREKHVKIMEYAIIPLAPNAGIVRWVTGASTLHQIIMDQRKKTGISPILEFETINKCCTGNFPALTHLQKLDVFYQIAEICKASEIRDSFWTDAPDAATWLDRGKTFSMSTALMSMIGYIIGLGDRHPGNIMVQRDTGCVIHIDFSDCFEVSMFRELYPESVPFRLTRMIVKALESESVDGHFRKVCEDVMWILRDNRSSIVAILEIFIHEPLNETSQILERINQKLMGTEDGNIKKSVETQVDDLIKTSMNPENYVKYYIGWCPFW